MQPTTEFRTYPVSDEEPTDRTADGTVIGAGSTLSLGTVDTTDEAQDTPVRVVWWRVSDMNGNSTIKNIRVWLEGSGYTLEAGAAFMDITGTWTQNKSATEVKAGSPGDAPTTEPSPNTTAMGGGDITGVTHSDTTQYIYITALIGVDEPTGADVEHLTLHVKYDYE